MKLGFIGAGNMAGALIRGILKAGVLAPSSVCAFDVDAAKTDVLRGQYGVVPQPDCAALIDACDMIVLAVKPLVAPTVLAQQQAHLAGKALVSIVAGLSCAALVRQLPSDTRLLRVMPNTPALCGEGMTAFSRETSLTDDEKAFAECAFSALGKLVWVPERLIEAVIGVSGSGPAYAYLFIEALADAGVSLGLPRDQATLLAAQTLKGSAEMVLATGTHPGALKDAVCSPGGTTIAAVRTLEAKGFRSAVIEAAIAAHDKAVAMQA